VVAPGALIALLGVVLALASARVADAECVTIDDFSKGPIGAFPPGWKLREETGRGVYTLEEQDGRRFLHAASRGLGIQAAKPYEWDLSLYPILAWSWRPIEFPHGSDERQSKTNDSALAVYAVFPHSYWSAKSVKYVWSALVPTGTHLTSSAGLTQVYVLRSGTKGKGRWTEERVNVLEDYRKYFETTEAPKAEGIAVLTDSDDTKSTAQGDYAAFRACKP
jgi:hypothetical protein